MTFNIAIADTQHVIDVDERCLRDVAKRTLQEERVHSAVISIAVVDNAAIRDLNRRYRNHDDATDVLSFLLECHPAKPRSPVAPDSGRNVVPRGAGKRLEGEVIISAEMAARRAAEFSWNPHDELILYLVHGLLHLVGYDDQTADEQSLMRSRERTILSLVPCPKDQGQGT